MLHLNDFVEARKRYYNMSRGNFISASEHCRKMNFRTHSSNTSKQKFIIVAVAVLMFVCVSVCVSVCLCTR